MTDRRTVTVAVDAMGGDKAPGAILEGVVVALEADPELSVDLVGSKDLVGPFAAAHDRVNPVTATQAIEMDEHPANAVRSKRDSSIVVGCNLVADGKADAFFSAGNTGACMAAATLVMGRIPGVRRPAIAAVIPGEGRPTVVLDVGANAEAKAEDLVQFAQMGAAYASIVLGRPSPSIGLLSIGEEPTKGSSLEQEAHGLLAEGVPGFAGNVEGGDIPCGKVDVVVTDGFTGNVALKLMEGLSKSLLRQLRDAVSSSPGGRLASPLIASAVKDLGKRLDPDTYGGAPLLGTAGICIIGHGGSGPEAVSAAIAVAATAARGRLVQRIAEAVSDASDR